MILFDGESSLNTSTARKLLRQKYNVEIKADPGFKRTMAERSVKEIKLRTSICLDLQGTDHLI